MYLNRWSQTAESPNRRMRTAGGLMIERYCASHFTFLVLTSRSRGQSRIDMVERLLSAV